MMSATLSLKLKVWRQQGPTSKGSFEDFDLTDVPTDLSFLEMLDMLNEQILNAGGDPIVFDHDCREGICGSCGFMIDGQAHGPERGTTVCQLHMRHYKDGDTVVLEPWRASAFPVLKDLMVDRSAFDAIQQAGGYISVNCGNAPDANSVPVGKEEASNAFESAVCVGCGACVASCKNASASLFTGAKINHLGNLPQGRPEGARRAIRMVETMEERGFGACSNTLECEAACPKEISVKVIQKMNRDYLLAKLTHPTD